MSEFDFRAVFDDLAAGMSLEVACKPAGRPSKRTVLKRVKSDQALAEAYNEALAARAETRIEKIGEVCNRLELGTIDPQSARVLIDTQKWLASKDSDRFSDRQRIEATGKDGAPLIPPRELPDEFECARFLGSMLYGKGVRTIIDGGELAALPGGST